jgi:hypothetical protein
LNQDEIKAVMMKNFERYYIESLKRSWFLADRTERKLRLKYVIELSVELNKIKQHGIFAVGLGEGAIEKIIEGDYEEANRYASDFTFEHDGPEVAKQYGPLWERFRELLHEARDHALVLSVMNL